MKQKFLLRAKDNKLANRWSKHPLQSERLNIAEVSYPPGEPLSQAALWPSQRGSSGFLRKATVKKGLWKDDCPTLRLRRKL